MLRLTATATLLASFATLSFAHTWNEIFRNIAIDTANYVGDPGYPRGYIAQTDPEFATEGDAGIVYLLPPAEARMPDGTVRLRINESDLLCHPNQRAVGGSAYVNPTYPMLKVAPGGYVAMSYLENGHVTLPWNQAGKPANGGTVYVYGTTQPSATEKIATVLQWNRDGTGGDGRGFLMTAQNFDDGRCHQINSCTDSAIRQVLFPNLVANDSAAGPQELWCETNVKIPDNQAPGLLTVYWVWQWPTAPNEDCTFVDGKDEYYTTCSDFEIVDPNAAAQVKDAAPVNTLSQMDATTKAVSTFSARTADTTTPSIIMQNWNVKIAATPTPDSSVASSCAIVLSSLAAQAGIPPPLCPSGKWATGELFASISQSVLAAVKAGQTETLIGAGGPSNAPVPAPSQAAPTSAPVTSQAAPAPTEIASASAPAPAPESTDTVFTTSAMYTTTITSVVTVGVNPSPGPGAPPTQPQFGPPQGQAPPGQGFGGPPSGGITFNTITTAGGAFEHLARHRRHARHFG